MSKSPQQSIEEDLIEFDRLFNTESMKVSVKIDGYATPPILEELQREANERYILFTKKFLSSKLSQAYQRGVEEALDGRSLHDILSIWVRNRFLDRWERVNETEYRIILASLKEDK